MRVLFYVGYQKSKFDKLTYLEHGLGGSEYAVIKLAEQFASNGHEVIVSGEVYTEFIDGVNYTHSDELERDQHFDVVIATNYIHYILFLESLNITFDKSYFWMHNDSFYPWYRGEKLINDGHDYLLSDKMTKIVCVSKIQADDIKQQHPQVSDKILYIENAIDPSDFEQVDVERVNDQFLYTSAPDRGLKNLLDIWPLIKDMKPNATLYVASPPYAVEWLAEYEGDYTDVTFLGNLPPSKLYKLIKQSEYWVYPSQYYETYCITALEMMAGGVKIITTDTGNLKTLLDTRAGVVDHTPPIGAVNQMILDTITFLDERPTIQQNYLTNAYNYAMNQTWANRYTEWNGLIQDESNTPTRLHPELYTYYDDIDEWKNRFITYSARTKEWDLITDEPFTNTFSFPLFTSEFCRMIREEAEHSNAWTINRHDYYPTTDMVLQTIGLHDIYMEVLREYVMQMSVHMWALEGEGWDNLQSENFLAKYTPNAQGHLAIHHDSSDITALVQLSDLDEYDGGGTWFRRQKQLLKNPIGYVTIHPGNITHKHGARAVTDGTRYIIVSFMKNPKR
jgi:glycosyltransferase involved in cell wall biosynthesis